MCIIPFPTLSSSTSRIYLQQNPETRKRVQPPDPADHGRYSTSPQGLINFRIIIQIRSANSRKPPWSMIIQSFWLGVQQKQDDTSKHSKLTNMPTQIRISLSALV